MALVKVASVNDIPENAIVPVSTPAGSIALTRISGEICAFQNVCTHDDNPLDDGKIEGEEVVCSRHGARFNVRTGRVCRMPATSDIEVYPVQVTGQDVFLELNHGL